VGHICSFLHGTKQGQRASKKIKKDDKPQKEIVLNWIAEHLE
jgi:hypothetical protein